MPSNFRTTSGKSKTIGHAYATPFPITLDPSPYEGSIIYADNDKLYYSDGASWIEVGSSGATSKDIIAPVAFANVDGQSGTGINVSYGSWNAINGTLDFTFTVAEPDTNYIVITDGENQDDGNLVQISNKTAAGFQATFYDSVGGVEEPTTSNRFGIIVYSSVPTEQVGAGVQGPQGTQGLQGVQGNYGRSWNIIGSVPDVDTGGDPQATLNAAFPSAVTGDAVVDDADNELWIYDGATWINIGSFLGVQGNQGFVGDQGVQGEIGPCVP